MVTAAMTERLNWLTDHINKVISLLFNMLSRLVIIFFQGASVFNFVAAITICGDFGAQENKVCQYFYCFPIYLPWSEGPWMPWSSFSEFCSLSQLFHSPLSFYQKDLYFFIFCHKVIVICISQVFYVLLLSNFNIYNSKHLNI